MLQALYWTGISVLTLASVSAGTLLHLAGNEEMVTPSDGVSSEEPLAIGIEGVKKELDVPPEGVAQSNFIQMTPNERYTNGAFCRFFPKGDGFYAMTFGAGEYDENGDWTGFSGSGNGYVYEMYDALLLPTGEHGEIFPNVGDAAVQLIGDRFYYFAMDRAEPTVIAYDLETWEEIDRQVLNMDLESMGSNDQMLAFANGMLDASGLYVEGGFGSTKADPRRGEATHHHLLTLDLEIIDEFELTDAEHVNGSSLVFAQDMYHLVSSRAFFGELLVLQYDEDWNFLGEKILTETDAQWPQGTVYDEERERFYVSFLDVSKKGSANVVLGIFDKHWEQIALIPVTDVENGLEAGRPYVTQDGDRLFVTFDVSSRTSDGRTNKDWKCFLSEYHLE